MVIFLLVIPALIIVSAAYLYKFNGKKELFRFDLVQFFYAFVFGPILFVWVKSFLFFLLRQELGSSLSVNNIFVVDTSLSILMFYVAAFGVIHSLTKSFNIKKEKDPFFDIYELSEYFHDFFSHVIIYLGMLAIFTIMSILNLFFPLPLLLSRGAMLFVLLAGLLIGAVGYVSIWLYDSKDYRKLARIMKLSFIASFCLHAGLYFLMTPSFSGEFVIYWLIFMGTIGAGTFGFFFKRSQTALKLFSKFHPLPSYMYIKNNTT